MAEDSSPGQNILHGQWGSPVVIEVGGATQVVFPGGDGWLYSFAPTESVDGSPRLIWKFDCNPKESLWSAGTRSTRNNLIHGPTFHDGLLYIALGRDPEHGAGPGGLWCIDPSGAGDVSAQLVFNHADPSQPVRHKRKQACDPGVGDYTAPNPNSRAVWRFVQQDSSANGEYEIEETMSRSLSKIAIKDDLLFVSDTAGILHCLDRRSGKQHWGYDTLAPVYATPLIVDNQVFLGTEDGEICVFACSANRSVAFPGGEPVRRIQCESKVNASVVHDSNVLYFASQDKLFALQRKAVTVR